MGLASDRACEGRRDGIAIVAERAPLAPPVRSPIIGSSPPTYEEWIRLPAQLQGGVFQQNRPNAGHCELRPQHLQAAV